jgi:uncharacterized membrane protein YjjB (DUF3815 family)
MFLTSVKSIEALRIFLYCFQVYFKLYYRVLIVCLLTSCTSIGIRFNFCWRGSCAALQVARTSVSSRFVSNALTKFRIPSLEARGDVKPNLYNFQLRRGDYLGV